MGDISPSPKFWLDRRQWTVLSLSFLKHEILGWSKSEDILAFSSCPSLVWEYGHLLRCISSDAKSYFWIFYLKYACFQAKKDGSHFWRILHALKMGPIYRDQFVSLHYFSMYSIPFLKLPKYPRLRKSGWRKLITMEIEGSKWSHHQKQTRNVQSFCDADPFFF